MYRALRGHIYTSELDTGRIISQVSSLPNSIEEVGEILQVYLTGPMTPEQAKQAAVFHEVRRDQVLQLYSFYEQHNTQFNTWPKPDPQKFADLPENDPKPVGVVIDLTSTGNKEAELADASYDSRTGPKTAFDADSQPDGFTVTGEVPTVELDPAEFMAQAQTPPTTQDAMNQFLIVASRSPSTDWFPTFLINCFPWLFPFGRGGPNEVRKSKISEWELAGMYIRKSTRAFRSYEFVLAVYNIIARKTAGLHTYIRSTIGNNPNYTGNQPSVYDLIGQLTEQQLITAGEYLQARKQSLRSKRPVPKPPMSLCTAKLDLKFWREVTIMSYKIILISLSFGVSSLPDVG